MLRVLVVLVSVGAVPAWAGKLSLHQCDEKLASCNDDCSLSHGSSTTDAARVKLAKCLIHCEDRDKSCRERYFDAEKKKEATTDDIRKNAAADSARSAVKVAPPSPAVAPEKTGPVAPPTVPAVAPAAPPPASATGSSPVPKAVATPATRPQATPPTQTNVKPVNTTDPGAATPPTAPQVPMIPDAGQTAKKRALDEWNAE